MGNELKHSISDETILVGIGIGLLLPLFLVVDVRPSLGCELVMGICCLLSLLCFIQVWKLRRK